MRLHVKNPPSQRHIQQEIATTAHLYADIQTKKLDTWVAPQRWDRSATRNTMCEICFQPVSCCPSIDITCSLCNVVAHISCLTNEQRNQCFRNSWICGDCASDIEYSKEHFIVNRTKKNYLEAATAGQISISKVWRRYRIFRMYRTAIRAILRLQGNAFIVKCSPDMLLVVEFARSLHRKQLLMGFRRSLIRPLSLRVVRCLDLPICDADTEKCDPYIYISTVNAKNEQEWLMKTRVISESLNPEFNEDFLLPGISGCDKVCRVMSLVNSFAVTQYMVH